MSVEKSARDFYKALHEGCWLSKNQSNATQSPRKSKEKSVYSSTLILSILMVDILLHRSHDMYRCALRFE